MNGFDFDVTYRLPRMDVGRIVLNTNWTYLNDFHTYVSNGAPRTELRWTNSTNVGGATPKWRGSATVTEAQQLERGPVRLLHRQLFRRGRNDLPGDL
ncbi:MAG: hypothetical protein HS122_03380 [Opitutaceae bacterium]|nr:hypothetical protein [Opitutaceae bacterium]